MGSADAPIAMLTGASVALSVAVGIALFAMRALDRHLAGTALVLVFCGAAYSWLTAGMAFYGQAAWRPLLVMLAACGMPALWSVVRLLFDPGYRGLAPVWQPLAVAGVGIVLPLWVGWQAVAGLVMLVLVGHLLWLIVSGRDDDLDTFRRRLRVAVPVVALLYLGTVALAWTFEWREEAPTATAIGLLSGQVALKLAWLALSVGAPSPVARLLGLRDATPPSPLHSLTVVTPAGGRFTEAMRASRAGVQDAQQARQAEQVLQAMVRDRLYRRHGLSIGALAEHLGVPEHRLRTLINGQLGFKNFSAFLNHYRVREVAKRLRDPADAHLPVLTIALDAGYASIGPFNRAFREAFGLTPTEYRSADEAPAIADDAALA
jgi:AraC-like DNA-binding protein